MNKYLIIISYLFCTIFLQGQKSEALNNVDQYLKKYLERTPVPGFAISIVEGDKVIFNKAYGVQRAGNNVAMKTNSILAIDALGRGFTAMAILQLVDQGKLSLDDPVVKYIPWFQTANKDFSDEITIRMCLSNTSGIPPQYESMPSLNPKDGLKNFIKSFDQHVIKRRPGMSHEYCDEGYTIAAYILQEVSGMDYADYIKTYILDPLKMKRSAASYGVLTDILPGHEMDLERCIPAKLTKPDANFIGSGSQFYASVDDLSHYMIALLNDGYYQGRQVITKEGLEELFKSNTSFEGLGTMLGGNGIDIQYALGWMGMIIEDRDILIHTGGNGKSGAIMGINISKNQAFAILFNADVNRFDRFEYPGMENTVNNVIHILNGEDTTEFGLVRSNLVTEENYDLPTDLWDKYVGQYEAFGSQNPLFKNRSIDVKRIGDNYLELTVQNQGDFNGRYELDFSTKAQATLRNISQPRDIQFTIYPDGSIGGLYMFGTEFKKLKEEDLTNSVAVEAPNGLGSFLLPNELEYQWEGDELVADTDGGKTIRIQVGRLANTDFGSMISTELQSKSIQSKGVTNMSTVKKGIWTEQSIYVDGKDGLDHYTLALYQHPEKERELRIIISQPYGTFDDKTLSLIQGIQRSIEF